MAEFAEEADLSKYQTYELYKENFYRKTCEICASKTSLRHYLILVNSPKYVQCIQDTLF